MCLKEKDMHTDEKPLRALVDKWLGPGAAMTVRVMEFSRTPLDRTRYVRVGALAQEGSFSIVFFRHDDGSWNVFPPKTNVPTMCACRLAG
jgi:hypothetical protein